MIVYVEEEILIYAQFSWGIICLQPLTGINNLSD
jgi:hypothetical protein